MKNEATTKKNCLGEDVPSIQRMTSWPKKDSCVGEDVIVSINTLILLDKALIFDCQSKTFDEIYFKFCNSILREMKMSKFFFF